MALILTFLGKGGSGSTTIAIAAAKKLAKLGSRVLLIGQDATLSYLLETPLTAKVTEIEPNFQAIQLSSTTLLEQGWEQVKELESKYLRSPTLKNVYGQELGILPGMDSALALNAIREYDRSGNYDVIVYDGAGNLETLRMFGIPEILSWYTRRFRQVLEDSDLGKILSPFLQPIASAILNISWSGDNLTSEPANAANTILQEGQKALANPRRVAAYLVTTDTPVAIAQAMSLWGSAQQVGLAVKGVLVNQGSITEEIGANFSPLTLTALPRQTEGNWQPLIDALPDLREVLEIPKPFSVNLGERQVQVFLPGFDKKQVKLTQYGPEITIDVGDQRRNIELPPSLQGQSVKGAKFQEGYLIISF